MVIIISSVDNLKNVLFLMKEIFEPQCCLNAKVLFLFQGCFPAYPLVVVPTLSQMSIMRPQSSVVLVSLVAFSGNISNRDTVHMVE